ncbi:MAG TPA: PQQ-binding-like beta-propeller repeat protein [Acetobacteraceae bacterium]|nr:PQQ-binding-like beta-propeller repeat protein [Acetobacteraceae bacterium]
MLTRSRRIASVLFASFLVYAVSLPASAADPEIDALLKGPVGKDWVTSGGNLTNQRYSTLKQINTENVQQLKGAWMTRLKGSGYGGKYSAEATPLVKDGIMYVVTGNDDVFALNAKTGEIQWERWSGIDQQITTVCCGWLNRGLAMGEGMLFLGQLDANVAALDIKTGKEVWKTPIEDWKNGYGVTSAPLYYDGIIYSGITGGEYGVRGRLTALDAKTGKILWRSYTLPAPGEIGAETWPAGTTHAMRGGASIWNTPALDPELGLLYFATGNCGPDYDGSMREGDNLFCASIMAIDAKTGQYKWHFQQVHHDIWDYDAASPVVLFDTVLNGQPRKALAEAGRTGWVYILDRTNGKPLVGIEEKPVPQEPRQKTAKTQPIPVGDATVPQCQQQPLSGYPQTGCIYAVFWDTPVVIQPGGQGGTNWSPMPYSPDTGLLYVPGTIRASAFVRYGDNTWKNGLPYTGGTQAPPIDSPFAGTFTAITATTNKIAWQQQMPYRMGGGGGSTVTAGGLLLRGEPDGNFVALNAKTGDTLFKFQTGFGADAPPVVYEMDGQQYISIVTGGNRIQGSATGDAVWTFALNGNVQPLYPPPPPAQVAGPLGPIAEGVNKVQIGANNVEFGYFPARTRVKPGTQVTFTNVGDLPHSATAAAGMEGKWDTDILAKGESKTITFDKPGIYYYICTPHQYMYGQVIVEP